MNDRAMPRDVAAERAVLGAMLTNETVADEIFEIVQPRDFYEWKHEEIAATIHLLREENTRVDLVTVADRLLSSGRLEKVGGFPYLHGLMDAVPTAANGPFYAEIVLRRSQQRTIVDVSMWLGQAGSKPDTDLDDIPELLATAEERIHEARNRVPEKDGIPRAAEMVDDALEAADRPEKSERIRTSWPDLNHIYAGHFPKHLIILGARPAVGKTLIALGMARHSAFERGIPTLHITIEISGTEVVYRLLACEAGIELSHLIESRCTASDWDKLARARRAVEQAPIFIHDVDAITVAGVDQAIASVERRHGVKIGLVVIDYLQLMDPPQGKRNANRQEDVAGMSRGLKKLAKKRGIPIIACAQLNRGPTQRADKRPTMSDLRESGSIEADADEILLLHRDSEPESERAGEIDVIVEKQRNGPKGTVTLAFQGHRGRAMSMSGDRYGPATPSKPSRRWSPSDAVGDSQ